MNYHQKNNTSLKYKDDLHVYKIIQTSWNIFKPTYTEAYFFYMSIIYIIPLDTSFLLKIICQHHCVHYSTIHINKLLARIVLLVYKD